MSLRMANCASWARRTCRRCSRLSSTATCLFASRNPTSRMARLRKALNEVAWNRRPRLCVSLRVTGYSSAEGLDWIDTDRTPGGYGTGNSDHEQQQYRRAEKRDRIGGRHPAEEASQELTRHQGSR